ncbi:MAG: hypothetical protein ACP5UD_07545 [Conexivisphaera sp.]
MDVNDLISGTISTTIALDNTACYSDAEAMRMRDEMRTTLMRTLGKKESPPYVIGTVNNSVEHSVIFFTVDTTFNGFIVCSVEYYPETNRCTKEVKVLTR